MRATYQKKGSGEGSGGGRQPAVNKLYDMKGFFFHFSKTIFLKQEKYFITITFVLYTKKF